MAIGLLSLGRSIVVRPEGGAFGYGFAAQVSTSGEVASSLILGTEMLAPPEQTGLLDFVDLGRFDITSDIHQCSLVTVLALSGLFSHGPVS